VPVVPRIVGFFAEGKAIAMAISCAVKAERDGHCPLDVGPGRGW
jgi:hypothetical protein